MRYETNKTWDVLEKTTTGSDPTAPANARDIFVTYSGRTAIAGQADTVRPHGWRIARFRCVYFPQAIP